MKQIRIGSHLIGGKGSALLIAGPCVIESEMHCLLMARHLKALARKAGVAFIFKASYDKANRMSLDSFRGPGPKKGLQILQKVKDKVGVPVLSDVHSCEEVADAAKVLDIIQIPALLCRQTDLVVAAAKTGRIVNIKKGQFLAPWDMLPIIKKAESTGNRNIIITERGFSFGYNNLVTDFRSLAILSSFGYPVVYDATHSVQLPGGKGNCSSGQREFVLGLSRAAIAFGCDGLFLEVHNDPDKALCDGPNMIDLGELKKLLDQTMRIRKSL
jgi:2-dehydro-3-deoxyphosphooctonate aldolase (KDO 8-P synthase)